MPREAGDRLTGRRFDVAVIGAGVNGSGAAQQLAAAGYSVLLVEKEDFCAGASGRSSRMLSCGIRYLAPNKSPWDFVRHPASAVAAVRKAREAMQTRSDFLSTTPERVRRVPFSLPIYRTDRFRPWQVSSGFQLLRMLGPGDVPLDARLITAREARTMPLLSSMRDLDQLEGFCQFREHHFDWPERIVTDTVLDAERMGAVVLNHTAVTRLERTDGDHWKLTLADRTGADIEVSAKIVLNLSGAWIDRVNGLAGSGARRRVRGTKGIHIAVRLPPECLGQGVMGYNRRGEHLYCFPWRDYHYFGPTETPFDGDVDTVAPTEDEIRDLLDEVNHLWPGLGGLDRRRVLYSWAGVRPLTYDPHLAGPARERVIHDLAADGMPNVLAMTFGLLKGFRVAGRELTGVVRSRLTPSGTPDTPSYGTRPVALKPAADPLVSHWPDAQAADLLEAAAHEYPASIADLFRRTGLLWTETMGREAAVEAARIAGPTLGWSVAQQSEEAARYQRYLEQAHCMTMS